MLCLSSGLHLYPSLSHHHQCIRTHSPTFNKDNHINNTRFSLVLADSSLDLVQAEWNG